ncbi:unnamed protein product [Paramecium octaurelia]|uniref:Uncharacterized protein n=1 Tax=Paramecium octaurelia TaxID=43137 RepID=A0A8S1V5C2_PAROT|nr:unnamed protein product [Paramecium octaurelia]
MCKRFNNICNKREMHHEKEQVGVLYEVMSLSNEVDEVFLPILINILKKERIKDCLEFLSQDQNKMEREKKNIKIITGVLKKVKDHDFNTQNYSMDDYKEFKKDLITEISLNKKIIEFLKFLVQLTALDETYIWCGSNSLHLLVLMKIDLKEICVENIRIRNASIIGANLVRCDLSGSEMDNIIISGVNLNQAKLFNCKWRNLGINERIQFNGHIVGVNQVCFSPDGKSLASCSNDNSIILWAVKKGKIKFRIKMKRQVTLVCFSPNNTILAFSQRNVVYLWNLRTEKQMSTLNDHPHYVKSVNFSPDGATVASSSDEFIYLWDFKTGQQKAKLDAHLGYVHSVNFSPDGTILASGGFCIHLWDVKSGQQKAKLDGHAHFVNFSPDGTALASSGYDKSICLWDVKTRQKKQSQMVIMEGFIQFVTLLMGLHQHLVVMISLSVYGMLRQDHKSQISCQQDGHSGYVMSVQFSPDGTALATGSHDNSIRFWDVKTGQQKAQLDGHSGTVNSICYSPDGTTLASGSDDNSIRLWDVKTGSQKAKLVGHQSYVASVNFSPDGTTLASGSDDKSICLWDVKTGQCRVKLDGHSSSVYSVIFSPDGTTIASGSSDKSIRLWYVQTTIEIIPRDNCYKDLLSQFKFPLYHQFCLYNYHTILRICKNPILEIEGALILKGEFIDYQGYDLRQLFKSKGSFILENELKQKQS